MNRDRSIWLIGLLLTFIACQKETEDPLPMDYEYMPLMTGAYHIFQVDSIVWDDYYSPPEVDTFRYKLKQIITDTFRDGTGNIVYRAEQYIKKHDSLPWKVDIAFSFAREKTRLLKTINNQIFVQMVFPVQAGTYWDGNAYNSMENQDYEYIDVHKDKQINGKTYEKTVTVEQENFQSLVTNEQAVECYAPQTGMIYKEVISQELDIQSGQIEKGYKYTYKLLDYHVE